MAVKLASVGDHFSKAAKSIRLIGHGCTNRPFYHINVTYRRILNSQPVIEQLGSFDPQPNMFNEKLVALNIERIKFWTGQGAHVSKPVAQILGLAGLYPVRPRSFMVAWRNRNPEHNTEEILGKINYKCYH